MKSTSLDLLCCPACRGRLTAGEASHGQIESGSLHCTICGTEYPVAAGIPQFIRTSELTGRNRRISRAYDWFSLIYRAFSTAAFTFIGMREESARREITDRLEPHGGDVLEVSIGPGVNLPYLIDREDVGAIHGLDISPGQLSRCREYTRRHAWEVELVLGTAECLPYREEAFASVFHVGGINFFNDKKAAMAEMVRVAKPGARILVCDETERGAKAYERTLPGFRRSVGEREAVRAPVDLIPEGMQNIRVDEIWKGWMYCLDFRKPG